MNEYYPDRVLKIPSATPSETDAAQFIIRHKQKQFNLCGEFVVAYCMQDDAHTDDIDDFLDYWQAKDLTLYQSLFKNGLSRTTGISDLNKMLADYDVITPCQPISPLPPVLDFISAKLDSYQAIMGVQIDYSGYLVGKGIPHWIVLESLSVDSNIHAIATIYNPFTNSMERYSWREIMTSTGAYKQGLWVKRS